MSTKITKSAVSVKDPFEDIKISAEAAKIAVDALEASLVKDLETQLQLAKAVKSNAEGAKKLAQIDKENANTVKQKIENDKKKIQLEKEVVKLLAEEEKFRQQNNKALAEEFKATQQLNKALAEEEKIKQQAKKTAVEGQKLTQAELRTKQAKLNLSVKEKREEERLLKLKKREEEQSKKLIAQTKKENSLIFKQAQQIKLLSDRYRTLILEEGKETRQSRKLLKQVLALKKARDATNISLGNSQSRVGQYERSLQKLTGTLAKLGIGFGVFNLLRGTFGILAEYDEKIADIQKTTGLASKEARLLSIELLSIDTRSSVTELQELASAAGRLGIEGSQNIIEFVTAADKAFVALGDDLGGTAEEIATNLGKIAANFGLIEEFGIGGAIERVGSVMNELAAGSKASAGAIFDFTNRLAGIGAIADIAQQDIQALGALFDAHGQSIEVAASTLAKLLPALSSDQEEFAKVAGLTAEAFGEILRESPIEALKAVAVGAKSSKGGLDGLVATLEAFGIESARSAGIVGVLANNTEELTELQELANEAFENNISLQEEFDTKNKTVNAAVSKLQKSWAALIIKFNEGQGIGDKLIKVLLFLAENLDKIVKVVIAGLTAWASQTLALKLFRTEIDKTGKSIAVGLIPNLIKSGKAIIGAGKAFKIGAITAKGFGTALKSIPFVGIISGLITIVGLFSDTGDEAEEAEQKLTAYGESTKKINEEVAKENKELSILFDSLRRTNSESEERKLLIDEINSRYGLTLQNLSDESAFVDQITSSYQKLIFQLRIKARADEAQANLLPLLEERNALLDELANVRPRAFEGIGPKDDPFESEFVRSETRRIKNRIREIEDLVKLATEFDETTIGGGDGKRTKKGKKPKTDKQLRDQRFADIIKNNKENLNFLKSQALKDAKSQEDIDKILAERRLKNREIEAQQALIIFGEFSEEFLKADLRFQEELRKQNDDAAKQAEKDNFELNSRQRELDLEDFKKQKKINSDKLKELEADLIAAGVKREKIDEELRLRRLAQLEQEAEDTLELFGEFSSEFIAANLALQKALEETVDPTKAIEAIKTAIEGIFEAIEGLAKNSIKLLDDQISEQNRLFDESKTREQEIRETAKERNLDATESITFEREQQKKALEEKRKLQEKQLRIEGLLAAFELIQAGLSAAEASSQLKGLVSEIPGLIEGTEFGVADALGYKPGVDSHTVRIDNREGVVNPDNMKTLGIKRGGRSMSDVVGIVKDFDQGILGNSIRTAIPALQVMAPSVDGVSSNQITSLLNDLIRNTDPKNQPDGKMAFDVLTGILTYHDRRGNRERFVKFKT